MKRATIALIACVALAGCGSSSGSSNSSTTASTASTSSSGGLKPSTTPRFAAPPANAPVQSGTVQIAYRNIAIAPDTLKVKVGSTIKWTNFDSVEHNVTSSSGSSQNFTSKDIGEKGTYEIKVEKPGLIHYTCTIHPTSMNGTISVVK
ncbi:MAG TPA: plastocyanin/azurin family copper-binding protein [Solirubrobacteraceae bacterium]